MLHQQRRRLTIGRGYLFNEPMTFQAQSAQVIANSRQSFNVSVIQVVDNEFELHVQPVKERIIDAATNACEDLVCRVSDVVQLLRERRDIEAPPRIGVSVGDGGSM